MYIRPLEDAHMEEIETFPELSPLERTSAVYMFGEYSSLIVCMMYFAMTVVTAFDCLRIAAMVVVDSVLCLMYFLTVSQ